MNERIAALEQARERTLAFYRAPAAGQDRSYAPGKWTARQLLIHLADAETMLFERLRRVAADDKPLLWAWDENRWAAHLFYGERSLDTAGALFAATRAGIVELARLAPPALLARTGVHSENGRRSFAQLLDTVLEHNLHHLSQLEAIAAGRPWTPRTALYAIAAEPPA